MADLQKEMKIRRRIESIYNKSEADFATAREFGDYEEEKEDIIFNLSQGIDVNETEAKIAAYRRLNHDEILANEANKAEQKRSKLQEGVARPDPSGAQEEGPSSAADNGSGPSDFVPTNAVAASLPPAPSAVGAQDQAGGTAPVLDVPPGCSKMEVIGVISGWHPDMPKRRALEEAYGTLFAF